MSEIHVLHRGFDNTETSVHAHAVSFGPNDKGDLVITTRTATRHERVVYQKDQWISYREVTRS